MSQDKAARVSRRHGQPRRRGRQLRLALGCAAFVVLAAPVAVALVANGGPNAMDRAIQMMGFSPVRPPNTLVGPGSLYNVDLAGNVLLTVCQVDPVIIGTVLRTSPVPTVDGKSLEDTHYGVDSSVIDKINSELTSKRITSVQYGFHQAKVLEASEAELRGIAQRMVGNENCQAEIDKHLNARELVCQGVAVLLASADYTVQADSSLSGKSKLNAADLGVVGKVLNETHVDTTATVMKKDSFVATSGSADSSAYQLQSGDGLYYGIKLEPICLTPKNATTAWRIPRNALERWAYRLWQLWPA
jgi:hypothetical protein